MKNRRTFFRLNIDSIPIDVRIDRTAKMSSFSGIIKDVSATGISFNVPSNISELVKNGSNLILSFEMTGIHFEIEAKVVRLFSEIQGETICACEHHIDIQKKANLATLLLKIDSERRKNKINSILTVNNSLN